MVVPERMLTVPLYVVPVDRPAGFAEMVSVAGTVVLLELTVSQFPPVVVVTDVVNGGLPEPDARLSCTAEVAAVPDIGADKDTVAGFRESVNGFVTLTVTGMLMGKPAPTPVNGVIVMLPWNVPAVGSTTGLTLTVRVAGVVPNVGVTVSQLLLDVAVTWKDWRLKKSRLLTAIVWVTASPVPPCTLKVRLVGAIDRLPVPPPVPLMNTGIDKV